MTLEDIRRKLNQSKTGDWFYDRALDQYLAAKDWGIDPDKWEGLSDEARGVVLEVYRTTRTMRAWEMQVERGSGTLIKD